MHRQFGVAIRKFPFSTQAPQCYFRVSAIDPNEPALLEQVYEVPAQLDLIFEDMEKWRSSDICFEIEGFWDLWRKNDQDWQLKPARIHLFFFGPEFNNELDESIRIELGLESQFLPDGDLSDDSLQYFQSNLKSLLRLHSDLNSALNFKSIRVWSESGAEFNKRLQWLSQGTSASTQ